MSGSTGRVSLWTRSPAGVKIQASPVVDFVGRSAVNAVNDLGEVIFNDRHLTTPGDPSALIEIGPTGVTRAIGADWYSHLGGLVRKLDRGAVVGTDGGASGDAAATDAAAPHDASPGHDALPPASEPQSTEAAADDRDTEDDGTSSDQGDASNSRPHHGCTTANVLPHRDRSLSVLGALAWLSIAMLASRRWGRRS
jgi:hypothetical protein